MTNSKSDVKRIEVPVASGKKLVAESFPNDEFDEIVIYLQREDGECQDIAVVSQQYNLSDGGIIPLPGKYAVKVFSVQQRGLYSRVSR